MVEKVIIMGAAGRDFHNFNVYFRNNPRYKVVAFTAAQIEGIEGRRYPVELCGDGYPDGIPIHHEKELGELIKKHEVDLVTFSYSDIRHVEVMHRASKVQSLGADFMVIGAQYTMVESTKPVVAVCAVRTGCGKSQTTRKVIDILSNMGKKVVAIRHPMPYGDLTKQAVQRFATYEDFDKHECTIEEREEYEPIVDQGMVVYAGIDYEAILREAEKEADVIIWDGGNNDTSFYKPDAYITIFDPHRAGHELTYFPGETNMLMADIAVINKVDTALPNDVETVRNNIATHNPGATIIKANSPVSVDEATSVRGKRVLVVEDGPTLTHGEMSFGAGAVAAEKYGAAEMVDPRPYAKGSIADVYKKYPHMGPILPAMGYSAQQIKDLEATIEATDCDLVLFGTPAKLTRVVEVSKPTARVSYGYGDANSPTLESELLRLLDERKPGWR
ncbi:cyclic 2,3-diphosphoglycerate synthase [Salidesulfovibrio onnuriiensis]|uniref:cyclic 2,3-diphosphoglycerate synthase n=1 Tax=Salidesulfovibrio onnuriiensis TaxID=2583823 RepID=UPI0011C90D4C|nr:cyclic 2,3-diphosphoglycerate synthase [Salidesulfovibrio onnuriiensis]